MSPANGRREDEVCQAIGLHSTTRIISSGEGSSLTGPTTRGKKEGNEIPCATRDAAVKPSVAEFVQMLTEDKKGSTDCRSQNDKAKTLTGTIVKCFLPIQTNICTNIL